MEHGYEDQTRLVVVEYNKECTRRIPAAPEQEQEALGGVVYEIDEKPDDHVYDGKYKAQEERHEPQERASHPLPDALIAGSIPFEDRCIRSLQKNSRECISWDTNTSFCFSIILAKRILVKSPAKPKSISTAEMNPLLPKKYMPMAKGTTPTTAVIM